MEENRIDKFQLEEYKNLSNAHFETNKQIGLFFRYFLLITSAPALIFIWFGDNDIFLEEIINGDNTLKNLFIGFFLIFISLIGVLSSFYLISLRLDSILYARAVNGIRKYFLNEKIDFEEQYRVLPKQTNQPKYKSLHTFGILVYAVSIINSIYFALGTRVISSVGNDFFVNYLDVKIIISDYNIWDSILCFFSFFLLHLAYYNFITSYRNNKYMKNSIIGIDIDGVLNTHGKKFCEMHMENMEEHYGVGRVPNDKKLAPEDITIIPVHRIASKNISIDDEYDVFNNPNYWTEQSSISPDVGKIIKELKNSYGYKIHIHSYRPWPQYSYGKLLSEKDINKSWKIFPIKLSEDWSIYLGKTKALKKITKKWLKENNIPYTSKKLFIEKSSIDSSKRSFSFFGILFGISRNQFKNRFYYTNRKPYRYFVEDTPENAIKLASHCEYVFLIDQPYNNEENFSQPLPINVFRVKNWNEIKYKIKELG